MEQINVNQMILDTLSFQYLERSYFAAVDTTEEKNRSIVAHKAGILTL